MAPWGIAIILFTSIILGTFGYLPFEYFWSCMLHYQAIAFLLMLNDINLFVTFEQNSYININLTFLPYVLSLFPFLLVFSSDISQQEGMSYLYWAYFLCLGVGTIAL